jgi:signal transduction histidine kinase
LPSTRPRDNAFVTAVDATNSVLQSLDERALERLTLVPVDLVPGEILQPPGEAETFAYFPNSAVLSVVATMSTGESSEVAIVGRDGMLPVTGLLGASGGSTTSVVQVAGSCFRSTIAALRKLRADDRQARGVFDRCTTAMLVQVAQLSACQRLHPIGARLPRWLLSVFDRIDGTVLPLSQQNMADMLGVHRPTIAVELQRLHRLGAIGYRYRLVRLADRGKLEAAACECHARMNEEYQASMQAARRPAQSTSEPVDRADALAVARETTGRLLITSIRQVEEIEEREQAESANAARDRLLALVAHQLKTPLQAILGWCTLAQQPQPPAGALAKIERNARSQARLIDDLLDAAQIAAGTLRVVPSLIDPVSVVAAAVDAVRPLAEARHLTLRLRGPENVPPIFGDADRLQQAVANVLMNSITFTDAGEVDAEVTSDSQNVQILIRDTGCGIAEDLLARAFDSFSQGEGAKARHHGVGLGLTIARALIELHEGTITLASPGPGCVTLCTITLPIAAVTNPSA